MIVLALLAATTADAPWNCKDPVAQQEMNWCAAEDFRKSDAAMNVQWQATAKIMKARDADLDDTLPGHFDTLLAAQRAWLTYRDAQCLSESNVFRGGTMAPLIASACKTRLTDLRTRDLKDLIEQ